MDGLVGKHYGLYFCLLLFFFCFILLVPPMRDDTRHVDNGTLAETPRIQKRTTCYRLKRWNTVRMVLAAVAVVTVLLTLNTNLIDITFKSFNTIISTECYL